MDPKDEKRAILTRAASVEADRHAAQSRGDRRAESVAERELRELWRRYAELERVA